MKIPDSGKFVISAIAAILAPLHEVVTDLQLISGFYQPYVNRTSQILGVFLVAYIIFAGRKWSEDYTRRGFKLAVYLAISLSAIVAILFFSVDKILIPGKILSGVLVVVWPVIYAGWLISLSALVAFSLRAFHDQD